MSALPRVQQYFTDISSWVQVRVEQPVGCRHRYHQKLTDDSAGGDLDGVVDVCAADDCRSRAIPEASACTQKHQRGRVQQCLNKQPSIGPIVDNAATHEVMLLAQLQQTMILAKPGSIEDNSSPPKALMPQQYVAGIGGGGARGGGLGGGGCGEGGGGLVKDPIS